MPRTAIRIIWWAKEPPKGMTRMIENIVEFEPQYGKTGMMSKSTQHWARRIFDEVENITLEKVVYDK
jgi:hypothetical protein